MSSFQNEASKEVSTNIHEPIDDNLVNYGAIKQNLSGCDPEKRFYITTGEKYNSCIFV